MWHRPSCTSKAAYTILSWSSKTWVASSYLCEMQAWNTQQDGICWQQPAQAGGQKQLVPWSCSGNACFTREPEKQPRINGPHPESKITTNVPLRWLLMSPSMCPGDLRVQYHRWGGRHLHMLSSTSYNSLGLCLQDANFQTLSLRTECHYNKKASRASTCNSTHSKPWDH